MDRPRPTPEDLARIRAEKTAEKGPIEARLKLLFERKKDVLAEKLGFVPDCGVVEGDEGWEGYLSANDRLLGRKSFRTGNYIQFEQSVKLKNLLDSVYQYQVEAGFYMPVATLEEFLETL